jgi:putative CocE/NonD family hydrolase
MEQDSSMDENRDEIPAFGEVILPKPRYRGYTGQSLYLKMRDGVRLAVDLRLPEPRSFSDQMPTLLLQSRYWRAFELKPPLKWLLRAEDLNPYTREFDRFFTSHGYALVKVDVRGTGASFGCWEYPWADDSIQDSFEIVEWIVTQPWSNGLVGGMGVSYLGTTAELLTACCHPAVKAAASLFNHPDPYTDIAFPGGLFNERFVRAWGEMDEILDRNQIPRELGLLAPVIVQGVKPVYGQSDLLEQAVREHCVNGNVYELARNLIFRDQQFTEMGGGLEHLMVENHLSLIRSSGASILGMGSWMDAGTADAVIRRFLSLENANPAVIGAWDHGGERNASPWRPPKRPGYPSLEVQRSEIAAFFNQHLKLDSPGRNRSGEKTLHYYTMGEERWKTTHTWPPTGMHRQRWHLSSGRALSVGIPEEEGQDHYEVDFQASSGPANRWWSLGPAHNQSVIYRGREAAARHMLTYLTPPLERDLEISGYPVVKIYLISSENDGAFLVYLEELDEGGRVRYITEGMLRGLHRKVLPNPGPYKMLVPYHSFKQVDALPLVPGVPAELHFGLLPTSVLIRKGSRLRLGIAGHDEGTFTRLPEQGQPCLTVCYGPNYPSWIEFPAAAR